MHIYNICTGKIIIIIICTSLAKLDKLAAYEPLLALYDPIWPPICPKWAHFCYWINIWRNIYEMWTCGMSPYIWPIFSMQYIFSGYTYTYLLRLLDLIDSIRNPVEDIRIFYFVEIYIKYIIWSIILDIWLLSINRWCQHNQLLFPNKDYSLT